jgi:hypothetical protein
MQFAGGGRGCGSGRVAVILESFERARKRGHFDTKITKIKDKLTKISIDYKVNSTVTKKNKMPIL